MPLRAVFVIKIALDHMEADDIVRAYQHFKTKYANAPMTLHSLYFRIDQLFGHHAVIQILRAYIAINHVLPSNSVMMPVTKPTFL